MYPSSPRSQREGDSVAKRPIKIGSGAPAPRKARAWRKAPTALDAATTKETAPAGTLAAVSDGNNMRWCR
jgi:hypothetical protein